MADAAAETVSNRRRRRLDLQNAGTGEAPPPGPEPELAAPVDDGAGVGPAAAAQPQPAADAAGGRRRRRRPQGEPDDSEETQSSQPTEPSDSVSQPTPAADATPTRTHRHSRRLKAGSPGRLPPLVPPPMANALPEAERRLLNAPLRLDRADIFPATSEPTFLYEAPAPPLTEHDAAYVEVAGTATFKQVRQADLVAQAAKDAQRARSLSDSSDDHGADDSPSGGTQGMMLFAGVVLHLSQGALAGASLMQLAAMPGGDGYPEEGAMATTGVGKSLVRYLAYAPIAVETQRALMIFSLLSFLGACDLHAAAPRYATWSLLLLHATIAFTLIFSIPTDVAMKHHRMKSHAELVAHLEAAGSTPANFQPLTLDSTKMQTGGGILSTALSQSQMDLWQALVLVRALLALLAWIIASLLGTQPAFGVPPLPLEPGMAGYSPPRQRGPAPRRWQN